MRVSDRVTWATHKAALKEYLAISTEDEDGLLQSWLEAAIEAADKYLDREFVRYQYRWTLSGTPDDGDEIEVTIYSYNRKAYVSTKIDIEAVDTLVQIARRLDDALRRLVGSEYDITRSGTTVRISSCDCTLDIDAEVDVAAGDDLAVDELVTYDDIPKQVVHGLFAYVKAARNLRFRGHGLQSVTTGSLSESYWTAAGRSSIAASDPTAAMITYLQFYKMALDRGALP